MRSRTPPQCPCCRARQSTCPACVLLDPHAHHARRCRAPSAAPAGVHAQLPIGARRHRGRRARRAAPAAAGDGGGAWAGGEAQVGRVEEATALGVCLLGFFCTCQRAKGWFSTLSLSGLRYQLEVRDQSGPVPVGLLLHLEPELVAHPAAGTSWKSATALGTPLAMHTRTGGQRCCAGWTERGAGAGPQAGRTAATAARSPPQRCSRWRAAGQLLLRLWPAERLARASTSGAGQGPLCVGAQRSRPVQQRWQPSAAAGCRGARLGSRFQRWEHGCGSGC